MKTLLEALPPAAVLDTNVVLDWMVFKDTRCFYLTQSIEKGRLRWLATTAMKEEFFQVLSREALRIWKPSEAHICQMWQDFSCTVEIHPQIPAPDLRCTDPDDQKFIDAALQEAQWLFSRDRAVLKLAPHALPFGVRISTPEHATDLIY
jgi:predicted nucleic acid-binding protein